MAKPRKEVWYLHEWFATQEMIQRDLITRLGWLPAKANKIWHGIQPPKLHEAAEIAALLNIRPHELLMPPEDAMRLRRLEAILAEGGQRHPEGLPPAQPSDADRAEAATGRKLSGGRR